MISPSDPKIEITPDGYRLSWAVKGGTITAQVERLYDHSDGVVAEVDISYTLSPRPGPLKWGRLDLMAEQTRARWVSALEKRDPDVDWAALMEQLCRTVRDAHRAGAPAVDLREVQPVNGTRWIVEPFVEAGGVTVLFAMGGTGKSMCAMAIAATAASGTAVVGTPKGEAGPVLYLDWETDPATATERLRAICLGAGIASLPPVHYRRQVASLESAAQEIRRDIARLGAVMVVVDSLGAARGGEPESADLTIRTFVALRSLGVPVLVVDHVSKAAGNDATTSFGSVYTHNLARLTWALDKAQDEGSDRLVLALVNRKRNNGRLLPRIGLEMKAETDDAGGLWTVTFAAANLGEEMPDKAGAAERIIFALKNGGKTRKQLASELDLPFSVVKARVYEQVKRGVLIIVDPQPPSDEEVVWKVAKDN